MSLEAIAVGLVRDHPSIRYTPFISIHNYVMYWDEERGDVTGENTSFGKNSYGPALRELIEQAKQDKAWKSPLFKLPDLPMYEKQKLLSEAVANTALLRSRFIVSLPQGDLRDAVKDVLYDLPLIIESADIFIDTLDFEKAQREPEKNYFEEFMLHYDPTQKALKRKPKKGFVPLVTRLKQEGAWDIVYIDRLREKDPQRAQRLEGVFEDIAQGNIEQQERLRLIESLTERGCLGLVDLFGPESYDILVALYGEKVFPQTGRAHISSGQTIRSYLGKCRKTRRPPEFDPWKNDFVRALQEHGLKPSLYERDLTVQRLIQGKFLEPYLERFCRGENIFAELDQEETDPIKQRLKDYARKHFQAMERIRRHPAISQSLLHVRLRKDL